MSTIKIELTGDVKSYIDMASGLIFEAGRQYVLSEENAKKFLGQRTEDGAPYFRRYREEPKVEQDTPEVFEATPAPAPEGVVTLPDTMKKGSTKLVFGKKARKEEPQPVIEPQVAPPADAEGDSSEDNGSSVTI